MSLETSFLLIESDWPSARAQRLLAGLPTSWVVVHRIHEGRDLYYAFQAKDILPHLAANAGVPVKTALNLHETDASPTSAADTGTAPQPTVVVSRGRIAGIATPRVGWRGGAGTFAKTLGPAAVTRAIEATAPPEVAVGDTVSLVVKLLGDAGRPTAVAITALVGDDIDVVLQASGGVKVVGKADGVLKVVAAGTPMLLFKIAGETIGPGEVSVLVFQRGQSVGQVTVAIQTVASVVNGNPTAATARLQPAPTQPPDLQLLVLGTSPGSTYTIRFSAADPTLQLNLTPFTFSLRQDPRTFFDQFYGDIEAILTSNATAQQKLQRLGSKGRYLFEQLLPPEARTKLWSLRGRIRSVQIQSEEPWVPWEIIKLTGDDGTGTIVEAGFLCEDYEVTRWVPGLGYRCKLTMNNIAIVVPSNSGLPASSPERDAMLGLASPKRSVTPIEAEEVTLRQALATATFDAIHFTGHGNAGTTSADRAEIHLDGGSRLRPEDLTGEVANFGKCNPVIFLNACEIGRSGMGLTQPGGWPRGFLAAGAGVFVGPFWKIADASAATFADTFYQAMINGATIGAATRAARLAIQAASDPTWLAYSVYAHNDAKLGL